MKIVICDEHRLFAESLGALLGSHGHEVVGLADHPTVAVAMATTSDVDACVMDLYFDDEDIGVTLDSIERLRSDVDVIVLTDDDDADHRSACLHAGAATFAPKSLCGNRLVALIEGEVGDAAGRVETLRPDVARSGPATYYLTEREREVLDSLLQGHSTGEIATRLGVRAATARSHVQSVLMKLGVHSRVAAVAFAVEQGLAAPAA